MNNYILNYDDADGDAQYIVFAIGVKANKSTYIYNPQIMPGWQFKRLLAGCYVGLLMPKWDEGL